jgi:hypothetical protein
MENNGAGRAQSARPASPCSAIVSNRFGGTSIHRFSGGFQLFSGKGLLIRNAETDVVVASECLRRSLSALVAVDTRSIHVESAWNVTW